MKCNETERNAGASSSSRRYRYTKVLDNRKHPVRGLWRRNDKFFARITVEDDLGCKTVRWVPLQGATAAQAQEDYHSLLSERSNDRLRPMGLTPKLADYIETSYKPQLVVSGKRSVKKDLYYLRRWSEKLGHIRLNKIRPAHLSRYLTELAEEGLSGRSVNLFLVTIRGALKAACRDGHIKPPLPFEGLEWRKVDQKSRVLFTPGEVDLVCDVAAQASKNGREFVDYLRFLQYTGGRRNEALRVRWQDIDFNNGHVMIGAQGDAKSRKPRAVDFNPALEAHLKDMQSRRAPDSQWLFPSPQRGDADKASKTFVESLKLARKAAGFVCLDCGKPTVGETAAACLHCRSRRLEKRDPLLPEKLQRFGFHDLRHHFCSYAIMGGADITSVSEWLGHSDCLLVARVYGHLAAEHRKRQAAKLNFTPTVLPSPSQAKGA